MPLELKQGKFYRNGNPVPLEFGNKEQIRLMNEEIKRKEALENGLVVDYEVEHYVKAEIKFKCECGMCHVYFEQEASDEEDLDFVGDQSECFKCQQAYEISENKDGDLIATKITLKK